jgi:antitoxin CptB
MDADIGRLTLYIHPRPAASGLSAFGDSMTARSSEGLDVRRRKLLFRAWRRGVREMDLIVGRFADAFIDKFDQKSLDDFEKLIEAPNVDLYAWVAGDAAAPADYDTSVLKQLISFHSQNFDQKAGEGPKAR